MVQIFRKISSRIVSRNSCAKWSAKKKPWGCREEKGVLVSRHTLIIIKYRIKRFHSPGELRTSLVKAADKRALRLAEHAPSSSKPIRWADHKALQLSAATKEEISWSYCLQSNSTDWRQVAVCLHFMLLLLIKGLSLPPEAKVWKSLCSIWNTISLI